MQKKKINFVITDLDDTIWDWLTMWIKSFEPYLIRISEEFDIPLNDLKRDFKALHQKYHTSEASFIYDDLDTLTEKEKSLFRNEKDEGKSILHEYYYNKKNNLHFNNGVLETLNYLKKEGVLVVAFTESNAFFTKYRMKHLEIDGLFDRVYSPADFTLPESVYRNYSDDFWEPKHTKFEYLPNKTHKPAPKILETIVNDYSGDKENIIYIGDKLDKDVYMANETNISSVYAKYGHINNIKAYELLREVTHWSKEDVQREKDFKENHSINPIATYILEDSFSELKEMFKFFPFK
jgi:phosphoglycolate phosphatase